MNVCSVNPQWGTPKSPEKIQRRYTSALPGAQGLGACACSGSGGPLVLARGTFQRDSLRGGERFPRASSNLPRLLSRGVTFLGKLADAGSVWIVGVLVGVWTPLDHSPRQRCRGMSMTFLTALSARPRPSPASRVSTHSCLSRPAPAPE